MIRKWFELVWDCGKDREFGSLLLALSLPLNPLIWFIWLLVLLDGKKMGEK